MNLLKNLKEKLQAVFHAVFRYPLTSIFFLLAMVLNGVMIVQESDAYDVYVHTFIAGALLAAISQQLFERFFNKISERLLLYLAAVIFTVSYYFLIVGANSNIELHVKLSVAIFALITLFIWLPSIKSSITFNDTFMASFKAFFTALLFSLVLLIGIDAVLFAIDKLLFTLVDTIYFHMLNIISTFVFPMLFFSLIPVYPQKARTLSEEELRVQQFTKTPNILAMLLTYVIIPMTTIYTIVLILYLLLHIGGSFWTNNLLEPLLVSYSVIVIILYILASKIEHSFSNLFRKIVPKVLIPLVLLQTAASIMKASDIGVTHGRYFVISFGIFALIAAIIMSFFNKKKTGIIVIVFVFFSIVSIIPPIDAFTYSKVNQLNLLEKTLRENSMIDNGTIRANAEISERDKQIITHTVHYLSRLDYVDEIDWLPENITSPNVFQMTFGFKEQFDVSDEMMEYDNRYVYLDLEEKTIEIEAYDVFINMYDMYDGEFDGQMKPIIFRVRGNEYELIRIVENGNMTFRIENEAEEELILIDMKRVFEEVLQNGDEALTIEEATVTRENEQASVMIVVNNLDYVETTYQGEIYLFIKIK